MPKRALSPDEIDWSDVSRVMSEGSASTINPDYLRRLYEDGHMWLDGMRWSPKTPMQTPSPDAEDALGGVSEGRDASRQAE